MHNATHPEPLLIHAAEPGQLLHVYPESVQARPADIDLEHMPIEVDWQRQRMLWMVYGSCHPGMIESVLSRITDCSRLVVLESEEPDAYGLLLHERERLLDWVLDDRLTIITGGTLMQRVDRLIKLVDINVLDGWKPILSHTHIEHRPAQVRQLFERLGAGLNSKIMAKGTYLTVAQHYLRNTLINAPLAHTGGFLANWKDARKDRPVLLVSAGPSLNKQLPLLAENQDLFTIIAVNTVWPILHKHGIVPDAMLALDRNSKPAWPVNAVAHQTAFCVDLGCAPRLMWSHGRNHAITTCDPLTSSVAAALGVKVEYLRTGGSVATSAFSLAEFLGANPIVFIGQDLALTDGKDHAEGYPHTYSARVLKHRTDKGFDVDGYYGGRVRTERQLMFYKTWFESRVKDLPNRLIINATEGGAKIEGSVQLPFATVCQEIRATSLRKTTLLPDQATAIDPAHMAQLRAGLAELGDLVRAYKAIASEARTLCRRMGKRPSKKQLERLDTFNQRIREEDLLSKLVVNVMGLKKFESIRYKAHTGQGLETLADAVGKYDEVYENIELGADAALKMFGEMDKFYQRVAERGEIALDVLDEIDPPKAPARA